MSRSAPIAADLTVDGQSGPVSDDPDSGHGGVPESDEAGLEDPTDGSDGDPVDYGWVMQVTFVATILVGAPLVAALSVFLELPTWESRVGFAARVGALVWFLTALVVYGYARRTG